MLSTVLLSKKFYRFVVKLRQFLKQKHIYFLNHLSVPLIKTQLLLIYVFKSLRYTST
jgi:hypothetical protein